MRYETTENKIAVIGLGNIGLPLAIEFGRKYQTFGFDLDKERITTLSQGIDNRNVNNKPIEVPKNLTFSSEIEGLKACNIFILAVQTTTNNDDTPNISVLINASQMVASCLKLGDLVVYESTVYPGCTENVCVPVLEQFSGLVYNRDFFIGYSPERINTVDAVHTLTNTIKITAGSDKKTAVRVDELYKSIIYVGTCPVASIKIAEAAKLLENAQRDINIAFMNEVAAILTAHDISFNEVWKASSTKWNFLKFSPGLVGGECLPLASNYLNYLSKLQEGLLNSSRKVNEGLPQTIAQIIEEKLSVHYPNIDNPQILILGITYKPNSPDSKGSLVPVLFALLSSRCLSVDAYDPIVVNASISTIDTISSDKKYHLIVKATNHSIFEQLNYAEFTQNNYLIFDIQQFSFYEKEKIMAEN